MENLNYYNYSLRINLLFKILQSEVFIIMYLNS